MQVAGCDAVCERVSTESNVSHTQWLWGYPSGPAFLVEVHCFALLQACTQAHKQSLPCLQLRH